ncbi:hypothetical protein TNCV_3741931 [Trichonephila clavipes]|nr:hypothetical protein TNCV_3741931 [Trichonephila clavipes]
MLSAPDKALLVVFYMNEESATIALSKFEFKKDMSGKPDPLTHLPGPLQLVKRFETGKLEDRARAKR